ncbi:MAG: 30S ribosomal protein S3 [Spirochaetes bacterium GWD1_27_9]|uniref:30S ribosomal protein S3 n=1 Tax=uncultured organism TaxID=155900 RepID=U3GU47_9ZZZZ|nr:30S ribosomal protein S3 [uncultured organism]OHD14113.1 MAG: 30S ribosomal protein S3 [Spirochaetes bacterium GWB1_27_13]OHD21026.1 MAG: 30S ribosomal protein S3 [Spirochaetes bacterium GWC1_27_15]OHD45387.1 MAG: 30S ribosomal protein S3 [Spirochaetes bacterium GWD1_27_9]
MGQKVNPIGLRVGIIKNWNSIWYVDKKNYAKVLHEDIKIRECIYKYNFTNEDNTRKKMTSSEIANVEIMRKPDRVTVIINSSRPGVIIGANGENILRLTKEISKLTSSKVEVKIKEIKKPEINAQLIANGIAKQIMNRIPFRKAMKKAMADAKKSGVSGIKVECSGRLGGADMARTEWYREGRIPLHTLRADIDYGVATALTTYGTTGIKVWVFSKEILKKDIKEDAGQIVKKAKKSGKKSEE